MSKVRVLSEILSNKIAAGEIVERPSSVIKELIENSIDADSTKIVVEVRMGGTTFIRVSDNGTGMSRDNALLSLERHATSKIKQERDLFSIKTLGFRGEAIPSIASVSKFSIITKEKGINVGTKIEVVGGKIKKVSDYGAPSGMMVTVRNLFFNTPARKKFLKSINTEITHLADIMAKIALVKPNIKFKLIHNGKIIKNWIDTRKTITRISDVLGNNISKQLLKVTGESNTISLKGWIANPQINRTTSRGIYFFVNGRWVKNKIMHHSLLSAYSNKLAKRKYPIAIIFMNLPYDHVDVNVHPAKHEVHFINQKLVHDFLHKSIVRTLDTLDQLKWGSCKNKIPCNTNKNIIKKLKTENNTTKLYQENNQNLEENTQQFQNTIQKKITIHEKNKNISPKKHNQTILWKKHFFSDLAVIGQYHETYVICESKKAMIIIDQHAAHERIVFEQLKLNANNNTPTAQNLLLPELVETNFSEAKILKELIPKLRIYGLEVEQFGGNTFAVKALPTMIDNKKISTIILELVEKAADIGVHTNTNTVIHECLLVLACHNALRAKNYLSNIEINTMLQQLDSCKNTSYCPHGRPIWIKLETEYLKKKFGRTT